MQHPNRSRWTARDILALAVVALCALIVLAVLICPGAGFEPLLVPALGAVVMVVRYYFGKVSSD